MSNVTMGKFSLSMKRKNGKENHDKRNISNFSSDLLRVTSSPAFRRLQDKTQLYPMEKNDYARTRLTHSIEVASVSRALSFSIKKIMDSKKEEKIELGIIQSILPVCCYLHDIGNPPFGHYGEEVIREYFRNNWDKIVCIDEQNSRTTLDKIISKDTQEYYDLSNFDGNAQGLRVVTNIEPLYEGEYGLNLTAAVLGGLIKYPYSSIDPAINHNSQKNFKFGYFKSEENIIKFLSDNGDYYEHRMNPFALLMEACDDIAMFVSDFEDSVKKGAITYPDILNACKGKSTLRKFRDELKKKYEEKMLKNKTGDITSEILRPILYDTKRKLIIEVAEIFVKDLDAIIKFKTNRYYRNIDHHQSLIKQAKSYTLVKAFNEIMQNKVYSNRKILIPELKGYQILNTLLSMFVEALCGMSYEEIISNKSNHREYKIVHIMSKNYLNTYKEYIENLKKKGQYTLAKDYYARLHLAVDEISGMTDSFAVDLYDRLMQ